MPRKRIEITTEPEIKELKRGGFSVRFRIPAHDGMPESKSKWKKFPDAKRIGEIRSGIEAYKEELENEINDYVTNPGVTLGVYARRWHEDRKGEVKSSTWVRERSYITTIENSNLAKIPIGEITPEDIDQFKLDGQKAGWSKYKQRRTLEKLKYIMKFAESRHVIQSDPSRSVKGLKAENPKRRYLPEKEQKKLLTALDKEPKDGPRAAVRIALATGFREGECLGLQWQDLHLAAGGRSYIALRRQLSRNGELDMPKNDEIGDIPIDDDTAAWLADWKKFHELRYPNWNKIPTSRSRSASGLAA